MLVKEGYKLYFYRNDRATIEMDFFVRDKDSLIPVEVKANDNATASLNNLINDKKYKDIKYGIKLCYKNIGLALKKVSTEARKALEKFFGKAIYLETYVKVDKDWRSSEKELKNFGYNLD